MQNQYPDTDKALEEINHFLLSDRKEHILEGGAGTGKSVLIAKLLSEELVKYRDICKILEIPCLDNVVVAATTHAAKDLLWQQLNALGLSFNVKTVHSVFGFTMSEGIDTRRLTINTSSAIHINNSIIIIDEASMIDPELHKKMLEHSGNSKFLYVGDWKQMLGVSGTLPNYELITKSYLTEIKRTSDPNLKNLYYLLRNSVETAKLPTIKLYPGVIDYVEDADEVVKLIMDNREYLAIGAFTNHTVNQINNFIRSSLGHTERYEKGECLIVHSAHHASKWYPQQMLKILDTKESHFMVWNSHSDNEILNQGIILDKHLVRPFKHIQSNFDSYREILTPRNIDSYERYCEELIKRRMFRELIQLQTKVVILRPVYASTFYKLQGVSKPIVFINLSDVFRCKRFKEILRMLYVGVSRARNRVIFFGEIPKKYKQLIER